MTINNLSIPEMFEAWKQGKEEAAKCEIVSPFASEDTLRNGSKRETINKIKKCLSQDDLQEIDRLFKKK